MAKILVVSTDAMLLGARVKLLAAPDRTLLSAGSMVQALRILDVEEAVDIIVADLDSDLEDKTGLDLARAVRTRTNPPPILLLVFPEQFQEARAAERDGLVADVLTRRETHGMLALKVNILLRDRAEVQGA